MHLAESDLNVNLHTFSLLLCDNSLQSVTERVEVHRNDPRHMQLELALTFSMEISVYSW